jgi:putative aldouronate transport system substrate-binding protein
MDRRFLKVVALLLCMLMAASVVAGCTQAATPTKAPTATQGPTPTPAPPDFSALVKFTYATLYPFDPADEWYKNEIAKRFNVEVEFLQMGWDNYKEKEAAWFASGDMPDTMMKTSFQFAEYKKLAEQGVLREIPAFGTKYPNLQKIADRLTVLEKITIGGKLYAWPRSKMFVPDGIKTTTMAYWARKDWLTALGYTQDVFTLEEFVTMCKDIATKDPGKVGAGKVVPFNTGNYSPSIFGPGIYNPLYNSYTKVDGKYEWGARLPSTLDGIKFMKRLYDEGVLSKDFYTQKADTASTQWTSGQLGVYYENSTVPFVNGYFAPDTSALKEKWGVTGPEGFKLIQVLNPEGKLNVVQEGEFWAAFVFSPKVDDAKMERMLYVMDWLVGEEGTRASVLGVEGTDWNLKDGKVELLWKKDDKGNLVAPAYGSMYMRQWVTNGGDEIKFNPGIFADTFTEVDKMFATQLKTPQNNILTDYDLYFFTAPTYDKFGSYSKEVDDQIIKMVISSTDLDKDWADWLASMKDKVDPILAEINGALAK